MDEELQKRNTDCVYFLASPLTCKKGLECEYRHSELARLNPRDCWYWLSGSCFNPACSFRHPPLDGLTEASSQSATTQHQCSAPLNKTNVPCFFYFNGFCNKGDRCSFLHGPDDSAPTWKPLKTASAVTDAIPQENKTSAAVDGGSVPKEIHPGSCENTSKREEDIHVEPHDDSRQTAPSNVVQQSASPQISTSESEEGTDSFLPAEDSIENGTLVCAGQSSEEEVDGHVEREEWLESSPGFDVLVDDESEKLGYDDDPEYLLVLDRKYREPDSHFLGYEYEDHVEYDPAYRKIEMLNEQDVRETYDNFDIGLANHRLPKFPGHSRERMVDSRLPWKRKFPPVQSAFDRRRSMDLRDHLKKRRMIDCHALNYSSRRHETSRLIGPRRSRERSRQQHTRHVHRRLSSDVENYMVASRGGNGTLLNGSGQRSTFRPSYRNGSREHYKVQTQSKHHTLLSEITAKSGLKKRRSAVESSVFSGPKTLAEIKEEKKKARDSGDFCGKMGHSIRKTSEDFRGPKPLSEILKDKSRLGSVVEANCSNN